MMDLTAHIRTYVPIFVGWCLARIGETLGGPLDVDGATLSAAVTGLVIAVYYAAARYAEQRWPAAGWLLGSRKQPTYDG